MFILLVNKTQVFHSWVQRVTNTIWPLRRILVLGREADFLCLGPCWDGTCSEDGTVGPGERVRGRGVAGVPVSSASSCPIQHRTSPHSVRVSSEEGQRVTGSRSHGVTGRSEPARWDPQANSPAPPETAGVSLGWPQWPQSMERHLSLEERAGCSVEYKAQPSNPWEVSVETQALLPTLVDI